MKYMILHHLFIYKRLNMVLHHQILYLSDHASQFLIRFTLLINKLTVGHILTCYQLPTYYYCNILTIINTRMLKKKINTRVYISLSKENCSYSFVCEKINLFITSKYLTNKLRRTPLRFNHNPLCLQSVNQIC